MQDHVQINKYTPLMYSGLAQARPKLHVCIVPDSNANQKVCQLENSIQELATSHIQKPSGTIPMTATSFS
jgi:hypothetical protein